MFDYVTMAKGIHIGVRSTVIVHADHVETWGTLATVQFSVGMSVYRT